MAVGQNDKQQTETAVPRLEGPDEVASGSGELIPDHALAVGERDLFDHVDYVERLVQVIRHVSVEHTSANIALYGPWGSGKSGIGNQLRKQLEGDENFVYADFDAFKFGRKPLLRNFIGQLAEQLFGPEGAVSIKRPLYETTSRPHLNVPNLVLRWWQWPLYLAACACLGFLLGAWVLAEGRLHEIAARLLPTTVLIGAAVALLSYFTTTRTTAPVEGDEEFEQVFLSILSRQGIDGKCERRLVVFIDELDRCSPSEVASTLESIRTFLGAKGCIFIVAADQQVLEHALSHRLRQSTPPDLANPYYSAGSAYLDKIFQYQLAFPPLRPRRLNHFALELVEGRAGVWSNPAVDVEDVVSILLPTHIHSPRRVKVLLNGFALTYGIAAARSNRKYLPKLPARASELAKLVCLKLEFPLFARELALDDRLPEAVLLAARTDQGNEAAAEELATLPEELRIRGELYARGELPVAQLLSGSPHEKEQEDLGSDSRIGDEFSPAEESPEDASDEEASEGEDGSEAEEGTVQGRHALQLVRYLEKTETVEGPRSDLIHLESAGAVWGLDPQFAEALERDARDNRPAAVAERVAELDPESQSKALLMLGRLVREEVGRDAENALRALLAAVPEVESAPAAVARQLVGDLASFVDRRGLSLRDLPGALDLAIVAGDQGLVDQLLARDEFIADEETAFHALSRAPGLGEHRQRLAQVLAFCSLANAERSRDVVQELDDDQLPGLLTAAGPIEARQITSEFERADQFSSEGLEGDAEESRGRATATLTELLNFASLFLETHDQAVAELAALPLFAIDRQYAREQRFEFLEAVEQVTTAELSQAILGEIDGFVLERTRVQLRVLDPFLLTDLVDTPASLDRLGAHLWNERTVEGREVEPELRSAITRLTRTGLYPTGPIAAERLAADLVRTLTSDADLDDLDVEYSLALDIAEIGLISREFVATCVIQTVARSISAPAPEPAPENLASRLVDLGAHSAGEAKVEDLEETLRVLREESWLSPSDQLTLELHLIAALAPHEDVDVPTLGEMQEAAEEGRVTEDAIGLWIANFASSPEEVYAAAAQYVDDPADAVCEGISSFAEGLGPKQLAELNIAAIERAFDDWPSEAFFDAADLSRADDERVASALVQVAKKASNPDARRLILDIWRWLAPSNRRAKQMLIEKVFFKIAKAGATGHELARHRLELVARPPAGLNEAIVDLMRQTAPDKKRRETVEKRLQQVGLIKSKGFFDRVLGR